MGGMVNIWKLMSSNSHHYSVDFAMRVVEKTHYSKLYITFVQELIWCRI